MEFRLTVLGSASAMPVTARHQSAQVLEVRGRSFLIDAGEGVQRQLLRYRKPMMKIESVFISHIHGDHILGLLPLLSTMGMTARTKPLNIYAPSNFGPILRFFLSYFGDGLAFEVRHVPLTMKSPEVVYQTKSLEISAFPLKHKIDTYGFRFSEKEPPFNVRKEKIQELDLSLTEIGTVKRGEDLVRTGPDGKPRTIPNSELAYKPFIPRSFAYCCDTSPFPELADWVRGADILYHEATYTNEYADQAAARHHSTAAQAAECALRAGVGRLVIGHYSSRNQNVADYQREAREVFPETYAASDGDIFDVELRNLRK